MYINLQWTLPFQDRALASDKEEDLENKSSGSEEKKSGGGKQGPKLNKKERAVALKDEVLYSKPLWSVLINC